MKIIGVIPVRAGSKRFPGKGLAKLQGKEIVLHVFEKAKKYRGFSELIVATDDPAIKKVVEREEGEVYFSEKDYHNGSERAADVIKNLDCDLCVNIQGDEVFITEQAIEQTVNVLQKSPELPVSTAVFPIAERTELSDPNLVKVILDDRNHALTFSRRPILAFDGVGYPINYGHVGIYAYQKEFLMLYPTLPPTRLELEESLEQLRIIESGYNIGAALLDRPLLSINTPADLIIAEKILSSERGRV